MFPDFSHEYAAILVEYLASLSRPGVATMMWQPRFSHWRHGVRRKETPTT